MAAISQRKFGVEIECGSDYNKNDCKRYCCEDDEYGCEALGGLFSRTRDRTLRRFDDVDCDGTCAEVRSPILQGERGFKALEKAMKFIREEGKGYVTQSDGMHVHHDAPEFVDDWDTTERLLRTWRINEPHIVKMLPPRRLIQGPLNPKVRPGSGFTEAQLKARIEQSKSPAQPRWGGYTHAGKPGYGFQRMLLNVASLQGHGSVEWRGLEGTLNFDRARAWIEFGQRFMDRVVADEKVWSCTSLVRLFGELEVPKDQQAILRKAGRGDPTFRQRR